MSVAPPALPELEHYTTPGYLNRPRWVGFFQQFTAVRDLGAREVLEIGPGPGVLSTALRTCGIRVVTVDLTPSTRPDVVADVRRLEEQFAPESFDAVVAFEVLEHLPWTDLPVALEQMRRVTRAHAVVSLPYAGLTWQLATRLFVQTADRRLSAGVRVPAFWRTRPLCDEHCWEVGLRGYSLGRVRRALGSVFAIEREQLLEDTLKQVFFVLRRR